MKITIDHHITFHLGLHICIHEHLIFCKKKIVSTLLLILTQYWIYLFYLTSGFKTILIFTYICHLWDFSTIVDFFFFCISALLLIKIEQTTIISRFIETAFNLFDVTGDGHINAKVFLDFWMVSINIMLKLLVTRKKVVNTLVINLYNF